MASNVGKIGGKDRMELFLVDFKALAEKLSPEDRAYVLDQLRIYSANILQDNEELRASYPQDWDELKHLAGKHSYLDSKSAQGVAA